MSKMVCRSHLAVIVAMLASVYGAGQQPSFRHFDERSNGGPQYVYDLSQGPDGILYIAAGGRVLSFDGHMFKELYRASGETGAITRIQSGRQGHTWLAGRTGPPLVLQQGVVEPTVVQNPGDMSVTQLAQHNGQLWFSTMSHGIWRTDSVQRASQVFATPSSVHDFIFDDQENLLAAADDGLLVVPAAGRPYTLPVGAPFTVLCANGDNKFWAAGEHGLYCFAKRKNRYECVVRPEDKPALQFSGVLSLAADPRTIWVAGSGGCYRIDILSGKREMYKKKLLNERAGLTDAQVQTLLRDREQNIWFGTFGEGLFQEPPIRYRIHGAPPGTETADLKALVTAGDSVVWAGDSRGLWSYQRARGRWRAADTSQGGINALALDSRGKLWAGTAGKVLILGNDGRLKTAEGIPPDQAFNVNHIAADSGSVYVSTGSGLLVFHRQGGTEWLRTNEGLLHNNVRQVLPDSKGRIWLASHGTPPYYIHKGRVSAFRNVPGLESFRINALSEDPEGNVWLATDGDGVYKYDGASFTKYTVVNGLVSNYCAAITSAGQVWVTHRGGVSVRPAGAEEFTAFGKEEELQGNASQALVIDDAGRPWLGTRKGLISLEEFQHADVLRDTRIMAVHMDHERFSGERPVVMDFGYYTIRVDFQAVSLTDPSSISYRYRLLGADTSWQNTNQRQIQFPQLADGSYTFEVQGMRDGNWLETDKVAIMIKDPVWRQTWFYILLLGFVVLVTYGIVALRTRAYRRTQVLLELKVKQKTYLLEREKDAVQAIRIVVEEKNKDITDSINYAKKIQDSILPPKELMRSLFGDNYFVFFRPKDIVSGDLYWASVLAPDERSGQPLALAAVVDCTGHGVPGAFLSIMANDFLRQSMMEPGISSPSEVLDFLNEKISSHLNQTAQSQIRDGMDIAMVGIDYTNRVLHFSGANNPVYIYRKTGDVPDHIVLTATKQSIGMVTADTVKFASREFRLYPGDTIYLFSDGFADQFGGENNKKFTYKRFREVLDNAFKLPIKEQRAYLEARFEEWKGDEAQTDDVCVLGIRIA